MERQDSQQRWTVPRKSASAAVSAAILAEYDPLWFERATNGGRGLPVDWPFCECGGEKCPDRGLTDDAA
ncbi:hypothetical protein ABH937_005961 [Kitasatospora sp. GAS1066B]